MFRPEVGFFFLVLFLVNATASKCPEPRKPHPTNCSLFYNCVNLPAGGYVWVPSKCNEGLVFESYLRMCVLPSETWSCDSISTESTMAGEKKHEAEVIKPYLNFYSDPLNLSEIVDSSYSIDSPTEEEINEETTPYSLNGENFSKFATENESANFFKKKSSIDDKSEEEDNFPGLENKTFLIRSVTWLDRMMDNLLIRQSLKIFSDEMVLVTNSALKSQLKTDNSTRHKINNDDLHNQFVTNYIITNNFENADASLTNEETTTWKIESTDTSLLNQSVNESTSESLISIRNNLGDKQYITREKYEFLKHQLNPDTVDIIACSSGIRLPNNTDCTKYYICEVQTATVREFSCPSFTGFNPGAKICDTQTYSVCRKMKNKNAVLNSNFEEENVENVKLLKKRICASVGKFADPSSPSHYYLCYLNGGKTTNVDSVRMMCPNNLIFCAEKKFCATKQFCAKYNSK